MRPPPGETPEGWRKGFTKFRGSTALSAQNSVLAHIARPYANALFELAVAQKAVATVETALDGVSDLIDSNQDFSNLLASPIVSSEAKNGVIEAIVAKSKPPQLVANFLRTVAGNGRLFVLPAMIEAFKELAAKDRDELRAEVTSAAPMSKKQLTDLARVLKSKWAKR